MQRAAQAVGGKWKIRPKGAKEKLRHPTPQGQYRFLSHTSALRVPHSGHFNKLQSEPLSPKRIDFCAPPRSSLSTC
jgi:hypothetical protein